MLNLIEPQNKLVEHLNACGKSSLSGMPQHLHRVAIVLFMVSVLFAASDVLAQSETIEDMDLAELDQKLNNPLTDIWSLTLQNNTGWLEGDDLKGREMTNLLFFQPFMPFEVGKENQTMFTLRPVLPLVTQPVFGDPSSGESTEHETGLGDIQLLTLIGPNSGKGWVWGAGATFKLPTASDDRLGQGKWQAGPAGMLFYMGKPWVSGVLVQHWRSFGGDNDRQDTRQTDIQYVIRRSIPNAMSIGMGPTITIDWEAESGERITVPIGLGITKTIRWGKTPVKLRAEIHYSVVRPDAVGTEWNLRFQVTPVINNPFN